MAAIKFLLKDCSRLVGGKEMTFYESVTIGVFVVHCWSWTVSDAQGNTQKQYGVNLYEHGNTIDPVNDRRFLPSSVVQRARKRKLTWCDSDIKLFIYCLLLDGSSRHVECVERSGPRLCSLIRLFSPSLLLQDEPIFLWTRPLRFVRRHGDASAARRRAGYPGVLTATLELILR